MKNHIETANPQKSKQDIHWWLTGLVFLGYATWFFLTQFNRIPEGREQIQLGQWLFIVLTVIWGFSWQLPPTLKSLHRPLLYAWLVLLVFVAWYWSLRYIIPNPALNEWCSQRAEPCIDLGLTHIPIFGFVASIGAVVVVLIMRLAQVGSSRLITSR